jgi:hypothetical protein
VPETAKTCPRCHLPLNLDSVTETRALPHDDEEMAIPRMGTAGFHTHTNLVLKVQNIDKTFTYDATQITELTLGRVNPDTGEAPLIDLRDCGAVQKGVSRRHAKIVRRDSGTLNLVDLGSGNGTYLNGQRLVPNQARILRDGDEIRLGDLILYVAFQKSAGL